MGTETSDSTTKTRTGWRQAPRPTTTSPTTVRADGAAMRVLRAATYVLTSLASLIFIVLTIYGGVQLYRLQSAFSQFGSGLSGLSGVTGAVTPGPEPGDSGGFDDTPDTVPGIAEDDYAGMRQNIARNGGQPSSSAESQYLYACETGVLPAADCP